jgi:hypothetical protein
MTEKKPKIFAGICLSWVFIDYAIDYVQNREFPVTQKELSPMLLFKDFVETYGESQQSLFWKYSEAKAIKQYDDLVLAFNAELNLIWKEVAGSKVTLLQEWLRKFREFEKNCNSLP